MRNMIQKCHEISLMHVTSCCFRSNKQKCTLKMYRFICFNWADSSLMFSAGPFFYWLKHFTTPTPLDTTPTTHRRKSLTCKLVNIYFVFITLHFYTELQHTWVSKWCLNEFSVIMLWAGILRHNTHSWPFLSIHCLCGKAKGSRRLKQLSRFIKFETPLPF